jgi:hypothetical protein
MSFFVMFFFLLLQVIFEPFVEAELNKQESVALLVNTISFFIALVYLSG